MEGTISGGGVLKIVSATSGDFNFNALDFSAFDSQRFVRISFRHHHMASPRPKCAGAVAGENQAARREVSRPHTSLRAATRASMSASLCSGEGVRRSRSVPSGTVG
jgi:hypothetical protein